MKITLKQIIGVALLSAVGGMQAGSCSSSGCTSANLAVDLSAVNCTPTKDSDNYAYGQTFFSLRPQHSNVARSQMGTSGRTHAFGKEEFHGDVSLALQWQQNSEGKNKGLAKWFSFNGSNSMKYAPAAASDVDIIGLNFGTNVTGTITMDPQVQNLTADIQLYLGWDEFISGLWSRVGVPINYVRTDMRLTDTPTSGGSLSLTAAESKTAATGYSDLKTAWASASDIGDIPKLTYGKIDGRRTETRVAGLSFDLGYDFLRREHGHLGLALRTVAPTGNAPAGVYLLEPVSGANNSWEVGGSVNGSYELWANADGDQSLNMYVDANITHVGRREQVRMHSLDGLGNDVGSSWLLLKQFTTSAATAYHATTPLQRAANLLALKVKIGAAVMADAAVSFKYNYDNFGFTLGANLWSRSKETAGAREESKLKDGFYAVKGTSTAATALLGVTFATAGIEANGTTSTTAADFLLKDDSTTRNIDVCPSLHPAARSLKVFSSLEHSWSENQWEPYLLLGGSYEFGLKADSVKNSALNQWGVMAKGGIAF